MAGPSFSACESRAAFDSGRATQKLLAAVERGGPSATPVLSCFVDALGKHDERCSANWKPLSVHGGRSEARSHDVFPSFPRADAGEFGVSALLASLVVALMWRTPDAPPRSALRRAGGDAAQRAGRLWRMRLLPAAVALATCVFVVIGLWRFEAPRRRIRRLDRQSLRHLGALFLMAIVARIIRMQMETRRLLSAWLSNATRFECPDVPGLPRLAVPAYRIDTHFPVVAVVGVLRPILVVDATVLDACSPEELSAILAHEHGHLHRWDNLRRAVFAASPDLLAWTSIGPALRDAWREATEEAADDVAASTARTPECIWPAR